MKNSIPHDAMYTTTTTATESLSPACMSFESLLSVPLSFFLGSSNDTENDTKNNPVHNSPQPQETQQPIKKRRKIVLLRSEAYTLLRIQLLSSEMDVLTRLAAQHWTKRTLSLHYAHQIVPCNHPPLKSLDHASKSRGWVLLRSMLPLLHAHYEAATSVPPHQYNHAPPNNNNNNNNTTPAVQASSSTMEYIQTSMQNCLQELQSLGDALIAFAEQNFSISQQLHDLASTLPAAMPLPGGANVDKRKAAAAATGGGEGCHAILAREKRLLGEVEEAVYERIQQVLRMATSGVVEEDEKDAFDLAAVSTTTIDGKDTSMSFLSMEELCWKLSEEVNGCKTAAGLALSVSSSESDCDGDSSDTDYEKEKQQVAQSKMEELSEKEKQELHMSNQEEKTPKSKQQQPQKKNTEVMQREREEPPTQEQESTSEGNASSSPLSNPKTKSSAVAKTQEVVPATRANSNTEMELQTQTQTQTQVSRKEIEETTRKTPHDKHTHKKRNLLEMDEAETRDHHDNDNDNDGQDKKIPEQSPEVKSTSDEPSLSVQTHESQVQKDGTTLSFDKEIEEHKSSKQQECANEHTNEQENQEDLEEEEEVVELEEADQEVDSEKEEETLPLSKRPRYESHSALQYASETQPPPTDMVFDQENNTKKTETMTVMECSTVEVPCSHQTPTKKEVKEDMSEDGAQGLLLLLGSNHNAAHSQTHTHSHTQTKTQHEKENAKPQVSPSPTGGGTASKRDREGRNDLQGEGEKDEIVKGAKPAKRVSLAFPLVKEDYGRDSFGGEESSLKQIDSVGSQDEEEGMRAKAGDTNDGGDGDGDGDGGGGGDGDLEEGEAGRQEQETQDSSQDQESLTRDGGQEEGLGGEDENEEEEEDVVFETQGVSYIPETQAPPTM